MGNNILTTLPVKEMSIDDLYSLSEKAVSDATPVKADIGALPAAALDSLGTNNETMGDQRNKTTKSTKTEKVDEADKLRDKWDTELNRKVADAAKSMDDAQLEAGTGLKVFLAPYWDVARKNLKTETDDLKQMLKKYKANATLQAHAATLGIANIFTEIETANTLTETLYNSRSDEYAANAGPSATSYKDAVVKSYNDFCALIELTANYTPGTAITALFNKLDEQRKKYAVKYNASGKTDSGTTTDGPTGGTTK